MVAVGALGKGTAAGRNVTDVSDGDVTELVKSKLLVFFVIFLADLFLRIC